MSFIHISFVNLVAYWLFMLIDQQAQQYLCIANLAIFRKALLPQLAFGFLFALKIKSGDIIKHDIKPLIKKIPAGLVYTFLYLLLPFGQVVQAAVKMM